MCRLLIMYIASLYRKPMTFSSDGKRSVFGLPGNPVSAFVTFHLFVLPAIRARWGFSPEKCHMATITVEVNCSVSQQLYCKLYTNFHPTVN